MQICPRRRVTPHLLFAFSRQPLDVSSPIMHCVMADMYVLPVHGPRSPVIYFHRNICYLVELCSQVHILHAEVPDKGHILHTSKIKVA